MNKTLLAVTTTISLALSTQVMADNERHRHHHHGNSRYAKVISVQPVYKTIRIAYEEQHCRQDFQRDRDRHYTRLESPAKLVLGGLLGGAIGHELGRNNNQDLATLTGVVIGTAIAQSTSAVYYPVERRQPAPPACHREIRYKNEHQLVAYDVTYRYHGRLYTTRMRENPGEHIRIDDERRHHWDHHH